MTTEARERTINFGAGPSVLPTNVLIEASKGMIDYKGTGIGVTELSHRSSTFKEIVTQAESDLRALLDIPDDYAVFFTQGGGTEQFSATVLNMLAAHAARNPSYGDKAPPVDYLVSGSWSSKAYAEAKRLTPNVNLVSNLRGNIGDASKPIPEPSQWSLSSPDNLPAMLYYCDNETIDGFELPSDFIKKLPEAYRERVPIVADCSSNILSRPVDVRAHGVIYFAAQKNIGPSGTTIVVVRRDLVVDPDALNAAYVPPIPAMLVYKNMVDNESLYNTPPMFPMYVSGLVFEDLRQLGGVPKMQEIAKEKSSAIYGVLDAYPTLYRAAVAHPEFRSQMNVTFRVLDPKTHEPSGALEEQLVKKCSEQHMVQVKGHRSVGGLRVSIYNAITPEQAKRLAGVLDQFAQEVLK